MSKDHEKQLEEAGRKAGKALADYIDKKILEKILKEYEEKECECGVDAIGAGTHSSYCPKGSL